MTKVVKTVQEPNGKFGSFERIVEQECPECGCNRATWSGAEVPGVHCVECCACEHIHELS